MTTQEALREIAGCGIEVNGSVIRICEQAALEIDAYRAELTRLEALLRKEADQYEPDTLGEVMFLAPADSISNLLRTRQDPLRHHEPLPKP